MKTNITFRRYQVEIFLCLYISYTFVVYLRKSFTFIAPVISQDQNLGKSDLGLISSCQLFAYTISKFVSGMIVDHYSPRVLLSAGVALTALSTILFTFGSSLWMYAVLWFMSGLVQGVTWPACAKILIAWFPACQFGTWWSVLSTSINFAGTAGPLIATFIVSLTDWRTSLLVPGIISLVTSVLVFVFIKDQPSDAGLTNILQKSKTKSDDVSKGVVTDLLFNKTFMILSVCYMMEYCVTGGLSDWGQMYLIQDRSRTVLEGSAYMSSLQLGGVVGSIVAGYTSDKLIAQGKPSVWARVCVLCALTAITGMSLYAFLTHVSPSTSLWTINSIGFCLGFGLYGDVAMFGVATINCAPPHLSGAAHSIGSLFCNIGGITAGLPLGLLAQSHGWTTVLWVLFVTCLVTLAALMYCLFTQGLPSVSPRKKDL